jgi:hypothetical protein
VEWSECVNLLCSAPLRFICLESLIVGLFLLLHNSLLYRFNRPVLGERKREDSKRESTKPNCTLDAAFWVSRCRLFR